MCVLLALLSRLFDRRDALVVVCPEALIRWHRPGRRLFWRCKSRPAAQLGTAKLASTGVLYRGLESLGGGSVLAGMILGAIAVFIIDVRLRSAAAWAFAGAILAFVGLIHGAQLGWAVSPLVALGYALFGATCLALAVGHPDATAKT